MKRFPSILLATTSPTVSNIYKYYVAYLLVQGEYMQRRELKQKAPATREHR